MIGTRKTGTLPVRLLVCLLLASLVLPLLAVRASSEDIFPAVNTSGNRNVALSVDPIESRDGFSAVLYNNKNGLPTSDATAIAQTGDGFLWIGSYAGLVRYDGTVFERVDSTSGIANVRCLYVDSKDRLWIGTNDSGLFLMTKGSLRNWNRSDGLRSVSIRSIAEDANGLIYIAAAAGGIATISGTELTLLEDERLDGQSVPQLRIGNDGLLYGITGEDDLFTLKDGRVETFLGHNSCRVKGAHCIMPDPAHPGKLYVGSDDSEVYHGSLADNFRDLSSSDISPLSTVNSMEYIDGKIWVCASNGTGRLDDTGFSLLENVPMNNSLEHLITDYDGNLWLVSSHQGVMKIVPNMFSDLFERWNLPAVVVNSTCLYGDQLFIGTDSGLIVIDGDEAAESVPLTMCLTASGKDLGFTDLLEMLRGVRVRAICRDSQGRLWIPGWKRYGVIRYDKGTAVAFTHEEGLWSDSVRVVSECEDGSLLVSNSGGLSVIKGNRVKKNYGPEDGIVNGEILTVTEGFNKEYVLGSDGDGIYVISPEGTRRIGTEDGLQSEIILRVKKSRFHDVYWVVTGNSLAYMTPDFKVTTIRQFPYPNNYDVYENSSGDVWVLCSAGIYSVPGDELLANAEIDPVFFSIQSGIPYVVSANSSSELTPDGRLYISGSEGVFSANVDDPFSEKLHYRVSVPYVEADGIRCYADLSGRFTLPANAHKITIYPYVFNYSLTDPQVSYSLSGFDSENTTMSRSKLKPVDYTNLKIGSYHFIITVRDPVSRTEQTALFSIVKGKEMSAGTMGTLIMNSASLLLMTGLFVFTSLYRKRGRPDDRLFLGLILTNLVMTLGETLSYLLEYLSYPIVRMLMILGNTAFYAALVFFPYLLLMYFESRLDADSGSLHRKKLLYGIPCFLFVIVILINLKTGWIFSIGEDNSFVSGRFDELLFLPVIPVWIYLGISMIRLVRINKRLLVVLLVLLVSKAVAELSFGGISSTSFFYTLILVCLHLSEMNRPLNEEVAL